MRDATPEVLAGMVGLLHGNEAATAAALDRATLRAAIVHHPTFFCPHSGACLDIDRAIAVADSAGAIVAGPFDLPGLAKRSGITPEAVRRRLADIVKGHTGHRVLDGELLAKKMNQSEGQEND